MKISHPWGIEIAEMIGCFFFGGTLKNLRIMSVPYTADTWINVLRRADSDALYQAYFIAINIERQCYF